MKKGNLFQVIEQVDEPRSEKNISFQKTLFDIDIRERQKMGWTNKLYIDLPFDVGADFSMNLERYMIHKVPG